MSSKLGTAVITGASTGIGAIYADRLARRGHDLILVARNRARLDALAERLRRETGRVVEVVVADLGARADLLRVEQQLKADPSISLLINNAGVASLAPLEKADADEMEAMIALNVTALTRLTQAVVPGFVARKRGTLINISSIVAVAPELLNSVYGGSKAFVLAFSQTLRHELKDTGIRVQAVLPGATATELWSNAGKAVEELPVEWVMSADDMVDAALVGLDAGEFVTIPALPRAEDWEAFDAARLAMGPGLSRAKPAARYSV